MLEKLFCLSFLTIVSYTLRKPKIIGLPPVIMPHIHHKCKKFISNSKKHTAWRQSGFVDLYSVSVRYLPGKSSNKPILSIGIRLKPSL